MPPHASRPLVPLLLGLLPLAMSPACSKQVTSAPSHDPSPAPALEPTATPAPGPISDAPSKPGGDAALASVARGDREFAARLYGRLRAAPGNLFFSPASIRVA